jgi:hypothetical protein
MELVDVFRLVEHQIGCAKAAGPHAASWGFLDIVQSRTGKKTILEYKHYTFQENTCNLSIWQPLVGLSE